MAVGCTPPLAVMQKQMTGFPSELCWLSLRSGTSEMAGAARPLEALDRSHFCVNLMNCSQFRNRSDAWPSESRFKTMSCHFSVWPLAASTGKSYFVFVFALRACVRSMDGGIC